MLGETLESRAVGADEIDVYQMQVFPRAFPHGHIAFAVGREGDPLSVRRPGRAEIAARAGGQRPGLASVQVENPEVGVAGGARADEDNLLRVGREGGLVVVSRIIGEAIQRRAIGLDQVEVGGTIALRREDDRAAVGRPRRIIVESRGF